MDSDIKNLLYRQPELYQAVYQDPDASRPRMFETMFERYGHIYPGSILDIGCGIGRDVAALSARCSSCVGVDYQPQMVEFARSQHPQVTFLQGDMRTLRLPQTFDAILCSGWAINNIHTVADLNATFATFARHAHAQTLLILVVLNAAAYLPGGSGQMETEFVIPAGDYAGKATARFELNRRHQQLIRYRTWHIPSLPETEREDFVRFRLIFPMELECYLAAHGFELLDCFDNTDLVPGELVGKSLNLVSVYRG